MIEVKKLYKSFNGQHVLKGIDMVIPDGKITAIIGASGGGKTVLLRHLIGLVKPDSGQVIVDGVDINRISRIELNKFRERFGMLFQNAALFDSMSVLANVAFPIREHNKNISDDECVELAKKKLSLVGLSGAEEKMPSELSGGMKKRAGLARALAMQPSIILYDEPTTGLDPIITRAIDDLILSVQGKLHVTSILISHDISSVFRVADHIAMLHHGKLIEYLPREEFKRSRNPDVEKFLNA